MRIYLGLEERSSRVAGVAEGVHWIVGERRGRLLGIRGHGASVRAGEASLANAKHRRAIFRSVPRARLSCPPRALYSTSPRRRAGPSLS